MDKSLKSTERFGRATNEEAAGTVFDLPILGDRMGPTPWELWERGTAQADWRDFVESSNEDERSAVPQHGRHPSRSSLP